MTVARTTKVANLAIDRSVNYECKVHRKLLYLKNIITYFTIVIYDCKTFIVQATGAVCYKTFYDRNLRMPVIS